MKDDLPTKIQTCFKQRVHWTQFLTCWETLWEMHWATFEVLAYIYVFFQGRYYLTKIIFKHTGDIAQVRRVIVICLCHLTITKTFHF